jgi:hypothetical protein
VPGARTFCAAAWADKLIAGRAKGCLTLRGRLCERCCQAPTVSGAPPLLQRAVAEPYPRPASTTPRRT